MAPFTALNDRPNGVDKKVPPGVPLIKGVTNEVLLWQKFGLLKLKAAEGALVITTLAVAETAGQLPLAGNEYVTV